MAVAHAFGFARDLNLNCPTETSTFVHHQSPRLALTTGSQLFIGSPGSTSRTSPSVIPPGRKSGCGNVSDDLYSKHARVNAKRKPNQRASSR